MSNTHSPSFSSIVVIGGGLMGASIASFFAANQLHVTLVEPDSSRREDLPGIFQSQMREMATVGGPRDKSERAQPIVITGSVSPALTGASLVIESVSEDPVLKESVWELMGKTFSPSALLATNTSSLSVTGLAGLVPRPERVLGIHFFNPAHLLPGVEVVSTPLSDPETVSSTLSFLAECGKKPVAVADTPGFVVNRLQFALIAEALRLIDEGVASPQEIDDLVESTIGLRWVAAGPMISADLAGLDVYHSILSHFQERLGDRYSIPDSFTRVVRDNHFGLKTASGLTGESAEHYASSLEDRFTKLKAVLHSLHHDTE